MTHVIAYEIEEIVIHTNNGIDHVDNCATRGRYETKAEAQEKADKSAARFNAFAAERGAAARMECVVVPVELGFANNIMYSDVEPFEIVRVVSDKTIEVRAMSAEMAPDWKPEIIPGGFAGHCVNNNDQRKAWVITSNEANPVIRIRKQKDGSWKNPSFGRFHLDNRPFKKYDFNF